MPGLRALALLVIVVAVVVVAPLAACADPTLPRGANVTCASDLGCPPTTVCAVALGRCVAVTPDRQAPRLQHVPHVSPEIGDEGTTFAIEVISDEPLGEPPEVTAKVGRIALPPFVLDSDVDGDNGGDERTYRFHYDAAGDEPEGAAAVTVRLVDEHGHVAEGLEAGSFTLDFKKAHILDTHIVGEDAEHVAYARLGTDVRLQVKFDEPMQTVEVLLAPEPRLHMTPVGDNFFSYVVTGAEQSGHRFVEVHGVDLAGNESFFETGGVVAIDFDAPQVSESVIDRSVHRSGDLFDMSVRFDEETLRERDSAPLPAARAFLQGGDPDLDFIQLDVDHREDGTIHVQHRIRDCETNGTYEIILDDVVDLAGNEVDGVRDDWTFDIASGCP